MRSKETIGKVLRIARIANGSMTIRNVADLIGVSTPYISEIENGKKGISKKKIAVFAKIYNFEPFELMELVEDYEALDGDNVRKYQYTLLRALRILLSKSKF